MTFDPGGSPPAPESQVNPWRPFSSVEDLAAAPQAGEAERAEAGAAELLALQAENLALTRELREAFTKLETQFNRAGREQFKTNALVQSRQESLDQLLEQQRETAAAREREMVDLRGRLGTARQEGRLEVIRSILPVLDGLNDAAAAGERLLRAAEGAQPGFLHRLVGTPGGLIPAADAGAWLQGVILVRDRLTDLLKTEGVRTIPTVGEPFDPHLHVAVEAEPAAAGSPSGTITREVRRGYTAGEAVIRYAEVVVAR